MGIRGSRNLEILWPQDMLVIDCFLNDIYRLPYCIDNSSVSVSICNPEFYSRWTSLVPEYHSTLASLVGAGCPVAYVQWLSMEYVLTLMPTIRY